MAASIVNVMRNSGCEVPAWMLGLPAPSQKEKKKLRRKPVDRKDVSRSTGSVGGGQGSRKKPKTNGKKAGAASNESKKPSKAGSVPRAESEEGSDSE